MDQESQHNNSGVDPMNQWNQHNNSGVGPMNQWNQHNNPNVNFMMKESKPYFPVVTFQQVLDYVPGQPETYTTSPIVNAVSEALYETKCIESKDLAEYLVLHPLKLAHAVQIELGMSLIEVIQLYRLRQIEAYYNAHPEATLDQIAQACGYASKGSVWRFFQRKLGMTVTGQKSHAGVEQWRKRRDERNKK